MPAKVIATGLQQALGNLAIMFLGFRVIMFSSRYLDIFKWFRGAQSTCKQRWLPAPATKFDRNIKQLAAHRGAFG
ncbi:hypothetical protein A6A05_01620 [Magnetospirillum moscoviense]|uniref:Uncharacterized protein n=1 Tax=Magnetospirillum moscoviense TaxID=1437059 RepID=A0A178MTC9_9PROT|nr:hypothetical protein A6A05_01620 [Magnetospirillum moscoviense]